MKDKKIIIIGRTFSDERGYNGPSGVIKALNNEFKNKKVDFELLNYDSSKVSKFKYILLLFKKLCFKRNLIVNVHTEGFIIPFIVYLISIFNWWNDYYLTIHGIYRVQTRYYNTKVKKSTLLLENILVKRFSNIICVSQMLKENIEELFKRRKRVYVVNNGMYICDKPFAERSSEDSIRIIITGGIRKIKGVFEALELVEYINNMASDLNVSLELYGGFDDEDTLNDFKREVYKRGLTEVVTYGGVIKDKKELYEKYEASDISLSLSHYDTFNVSVLESMANGTPCIVSKDCGAAYLIEDGTDGFVVDIENDYKEKIHSIITEYICNHEKFNEIRKRAYEDSRKYSWKNTADNYLNIFKSM